MFLSERNVVMLNNCKVLCSLWPGCRRHPACLGVCVSCAHSRVCICMCVLVRSKLDLSQLSVLEEVCNSKNSGCTEAVLTGSRLYEVESDQYWISGVNPDIRK